jgi:shikimate kinase
MNILLIGLRGSGKSTIGGLLAAHLHRQFIDLDVRVAEHFGSRPVREIWSSFGEHAWREAELSSLTTVLAQDNAVLALGGGTPMIRAAAAHVQQLRNEGRARVVYLQCSAATLQQRLRVNPGDRPSLTGLDCVAEVPQILQMREPTLVSLADLIIPCDAKSPEQIVASIVAGIGNT